MENFCSYVLLSKNTVSTHKIQQMLTTPSSLAWTRDLNFTNAGCNNKKTKEHKNIRMQVTNINQCIHEQAPACHLLMFIQQASLHLPYKTHSYKNRKEGNIQFSCSYTTKKVVDWAPKVHSIEELEYTSNPFEWILNSSMHTFVLMFFCLKTNTVNTHKTPQVPTTPSSLARTRDLISKTAQCPR